MKFFIEGESRDGEELWLEMREQNGEIQKRRIKERHGEDGVREMDELGESPGKGREGCSLQRGRLGSGPALKVWKARDSPKPSPSELAFLPKLK